MNETKSTMKARSIVLPTYRDDATPSAITPPKKAGQPWWRRRKVISIIALALVVIIAAGVVFQIIKAGGNHIHYQYAVTRQGNLSLTVDATGTVEATTYNVNFASVGIVQEIDVSLGQKVTKGQVLAKLNTAVLSDTLAVAKSQLQQQEDSGAAQSAITTAQDQVNVAQDNLNAAKLTSPAAGLVTAINGTVGGTSTVAQNSNGVSSNATGFMQIVNEASLTAVLNVNEADMTHIAKGNTVSFTVDAYQNRTFSGTVSTISHLAQTINSVVTYPVTVNVNQKDLTNSTVLPGMTASATIATVTRSNVVLLPVSAVSFAQQAVAQNLISSSQVQQARASANSLLSSLNTSGSGSVAQDDPDPTYVLQTENGHYVLVPVVLGLTDGNNYEVLTGLAAGSAVVIGQISSGQSSGQPVLSNLSLSSSLATSKG